MYLQLSSCMIALENNLQESRIKICNLENHCKKLEQESKQKNILSEKSKKKMKDLQNIADDGVWELQSQLSNINSCLFLEREKNEELNNEMTEISEKLKAANAYIVIHKEDKITALKLQESLDIAQLRITLLESEILSLKIKDKDKDKDKRKLRLIAGNKLGSQLITDKENSMSSSLKREEEIFLPLCQMTLL